MKLFSNNCIKCKSMKKMLDDCNIKYDLITDEKIILPLAEENNIDFMPFAEIDGVIYDSKKLEQWIVERK